MTIIEGIQKFIKKCPALKNGKINVDFLGEDPIRYVVSAVPCKPIIKKYVGGGAMKQYLFVLASRERFGGDVCENLSNSGFYEQVEEWLDEQNAKNDLPKMSDGKTALRVEVLSSGYLFDEAGDTAQYQMQLRLVYEDLN